MHFSDDFDFGPDDILVFVDEAGDARLRDQRNSVLVFGAILSLGRYYRERFRAEWFRLRSEITGDVSRAIHMVDLGRKRREAVAEHLSMSPVRRVAAAFKLSEDYPVDSRTKELVIRPVFDEFLNCIAQIISDTPAPKMFVVFEDGPILDDLVRLYSPLTLRCGSVDVPVTFVRYPKGRETGLDAADAVAHTAAERRRRPWGRPRPVFPLIFEPASGAKALARHLTGTITEESNPSAASRVN